MGKDSTMGVLEAIRARRAVRHYQADAVDEATVHRLLDAAVRAPTAMHREPWAFSVIQDCALLARWSTRAKALLVEQARATGEFDAGNPMHAMLLDPSFNIFYDAGTLVVIYRRRDEAYGLADCWLAAENLMLAAVAEGMGSCCIGLALPLLNEAGTASELGIAPDYEAVAPIILGVPAALPETSPRQPPAILCWRR
ncbi:MAG: nitroreductase [Pseudomonadota bacterium]|jgi:nitroreductase